MSLFDFDFRGFHSEIRESTRHRGLAPWHVLGDAGEPTLQNGWAMDQPTYEARYMMGDSGVVHIAMENMSRSVGAGGLVFTLPVGFRPSVRTSIPVMIGTVIAFAIFGGRMDVLTNGQVIIQSNAKSIGCGDARFRKA